MRKRFDLTLIKEVFKKNKRKRSVIFGVLLTLTSSAILFPILVSEGALFWDIKDFNFYLSRVPKVLLGALLAAVIEETFFRGLLLRGMLRQNRPLFSIVAVSLFYAAVHFIAPVKSWEYPGYSLLVGFDYLGALSLQMFSLEILSPFIGLFLVGLTLGMTMCLTQNIYLCIGLHAGWICVVKGVFYLTAINPAIGDTLSSLAKRYYLVSHPVAWISVALVAVLIFFISKRKSTELGVS